MTWQTLVSGFAILAFGSLVVACKAGGVGDPCIPNDEYSPSYTGATETGAQIEDRSFQCETRVCLINHFRGRVSCPFGNKAGGSSWVEPGESTEPDGTATDCLVPGTKDKVTVAVSAQCSKRKDQVYCSCRCGGDDPKAKYCECPSGYACREVTKSFDPLVMRPGDKYCVKSGDNVQDGYECGGDTCDQATDHCGFSSNRLSY